MNAQKRKSPDRKKGTARAKNSQPALFIQAIYAVGSFAARYPRVIGGGACFAIIFGFVSANALWYQPGGHPSPFLRTRDIEDPNGIPGYRMARPQPPADVTTFRIERADDSRLVTATPAAPQPAVQPSQLVADIQRELTRRGLYDGAHDGVIGTRTEAAILFFEQTAGLPQSGAPTETLLAALRAEPQTAAPQVAAVPPAAAQPASSPVPKPRPTENLKGEDPVAAAIRAAESGSAKPIATPVKATPASVRPEPAALRTADNRTSTTGSGLPSPDMVQQIQRGLANIAYTDVSVDGVAGSQTKAAIRHFERHYRLPETGEPNELVLKKLKSIGAL
ncbi:peptidoglycan hydrolase-like protein with peptidoglycan-binding domain [Neorhizobium huautlense]|uniref:Peptidoglycan hydrolase-like protein with peptidoglycan-binding domain n=1 Tax=Neorhizobium huautlense TaxID=67774 RepID=A0ABT9PYI0_9HYPH|nr:peptidoglycan-binding protein [Neorhizobium huautlense]MDP9839536.1 peptidoglycan hydrolase-like protein with peptidoglycan-binding domain [Neorhizobium huautlense]